MKVIAISDTHLSSSAHRLPQVLSDILKDAHIVIHAGDLTELWVLEEIKKICPKTIAVCGNMDSAQVKNKLKEKEIVNIENYKIGIMHGWGPPEGLLELVKKSFYAQELDLVIFGHSHYPFEHKDEGVIYFNPGSPTDKIFAPFNSYGIIEIKDKLITRIVKI